MFINILRPFVSSRLATQHLNRITSSSDKTVSDIPLVNEADTARNINRRQSSNDSTFTGQLHFFVLAETSCCLSTDIKYIYNYTHTNSFNSHIPIKHLLQYRLTTTSEPWPLGLVNVLSDTWVYTLITFVLFLEATFTTIFTIILLLELNLW